MADLVFPGSPSSLINDNAMPANSDLNIYQGDYVQFYLSFQDGNGQAIDLSGYTVQAQIRPNYNSGVSATFLCSPTGTLGQVEVYLSSAQSQSLVAGSYIWDIQLTNAQGDSKTYITGDVAVLSSVTTS